VNPEPFLIKNKSIPRGTAAVPGDKSITHRALLLSALSRIKTIINNFPVHEDSSATLKVLKQLGVKIKHTKNIVEVFSPDGLKKPSRPLFTGNSGTTLRLLLGVLAGLDFKVKVTAGKYLSLRPMARVTVPLRLMGAYISAKKKGNEEYAPIIIKGGNLSGITYQLPVASAQVKSAILLAGLSAKGRTQVIERISSRDHTERMLKLFGADISISNKGIILNPGELKSPGKIYIPGDISSAAFFMVLASIIPGAKVIVQKVSLNPSRSGVIHVLKRMKAKIKIELLKADYCGSEPIGNITVESSNLKGVEISSAEIPSLIDELPILMVAACFAQGDTVIKGADELRVKETDRVNSMLTNLKRMGGSVSINKNGSGITIIITGKGNLQGASLKSFGDHRTAMSMIIAARAAKGDSRIDDVSCINKSFPDFLNTLDLLAK